MQPTTPQPTAPAIPTPDAVLAAVPHEATRELLAVALRDHAPGRSDAFTLGLLLTLIYRLTGVWTPTLYAYVLTNYDEFCDNEFSDGRATANGIQLPTGAITHAVAAYRAAGIYPQRSAFGAHA